MMKGAKDRERLDGPLFPRLHINDTDKRGPRAPPRNKMALYEQLSIPSNRWDSGSSSPSVLPISRNNSPNLVSSTSSSHERRCNPYDVSMAENYHQSDVFAIRSASVVAINGQNDAKLRKDENFKASNSVLKESQNFSHLKNLARKKIKDKKKLPGTGLSREKLPPFKDFRNNRWETLVKKQDSQAIHESAQNSSSASPSKGRRSMEAIKRNMVDCEESFKPCSDEQQHRNNPLGDSAYVLNQQDAEESPADEERFNGGSETSMGLSSSTIAVTPDDVVKATGEKQFWKARREIVNQRRVFSLQVFELHKLIKVQKLIAGAPTMLLQHNLYSDIKENSDEHHKEDSIKVAEEKCTSPYLHSSSQAKHNEAATIPSAHNGENKRIASQQSDCGSQSRAAPASVAKPPWNFPSAGSQWLVPVMSPSEGLVYKPYSGSCPPPGAFMAPVFGVCGGMGHSCIQPYGVPVMNSNGSSSLLSSQMSRAVRRSPKGSEKQGSSASSPVCRGAGDALPLFPVEPSSVQSSNKNGMADESGSRVIKVVPRNARSATESAERIFQSIQLERKQYD